MLANKKVLAIIGARSGSKGLKDKNIKQLNGKPLIAWTIEAALASSIIDLVIVSTDSKEYAEIAKSYGAQVVLRPEELAGDDASLMAALQHGYQKVQESVGSFDVLVNLQPTSPLRTHIHIDQALAMYEKYLLENSVTNKLANIRVFSCYQVGNKYSWLMKTEEGGFATFIDKDERQKKQHARQLTSPCLLPNGAIFILPTDDLTQFYNGNTLPYVMSEIDSIDIDTQDDFDIAQTIMLKNKIQ
jgi:CMP-N-acetylneuraminic acid synthetase